MKIKNIIITTAFLVLLTGLPLISVIQKDTEISVSERRPLTQLTGFAEQKEKAEANGEEYRLANYFSYFEDYLLDQFPARDFFRSIKAVTNKYLYQQKDAGGYFFADGTLSKLDTELSEKAVNDAIKRFNNILETCFNRGKPNFYFALVPDKNYYVADANGYLHYDYEQMIRMLQSGLDERFQWIELMDKLDIGDYYVTDPHWAQEEILGVADHLLSSMGAEKLASDYEYNKMSLNGFMGTYYGQAALPVKKDTLTYLTNDILEDVIVTDIEKNEVIKVHEEAYFDNVDPYDVFLGGAKALLKIENPNAANNKQLVVFRDSFGSSMVPLLISEYAEIIVVDIRYVTPSVLPKLVRFKGNCDVLFLYSTSVLNSYGVFR